jgi:hypothetical protein
MSSAERLTNRCIDRGQIFEVRRQLSAHRWRCPRGRELQQQGASPENEQYNCSSSSSSSSPSTKDHNEPEEFEEQREGNEEEVDWNQGSSAGLGSDEIVKSPPRKRLKTVPFAPPENLSDDEFVAFDFDDTDTDMVCFIYLYRDCFTYLAIIQILNDDEACPRPRPCPFNDRSGLPRVNLLTPVDGFTNDSVPFQTRPDEFGVYRVYEFGRPKYKPEIHFNILLIADAPTLESSHPKSPPRLVDPPESGA